MKTIRFLQDYIYSRKGDVIEEGDGVAEILIQRGLAEEVTGENGDTGANAASAHNTPPTIINRRISGPRETSNVTPSRRGGRG